MEKVSCDICGKKFKTNEALSQHKNDAHNSAEEKTLVKKNKITKSKVLAILIPLIIAIGLSYGIYWSLSAPKIGPVGSIHIHAKFKIYIQNKSIDFSVSKYQLPLINPHVHLENGDGETIHVHATGVTMGVFLDSLGIKFDKNCLIMDTGEKYCNQNDKTLKFYVNGEPNQKWENYIIREGDKILISYGNESETELRRQMSSLNV